MSAESVLREAEFAAQDLPDESTADLLDRIEAQVRRYIVLDRNQATAVALWIAHTHVAEAKGITPYLWLTSAEKGSGKTLCLEVAETMVPRPWLTGSVSAATLARKIDQRPPPTLLLDESDAAFKGDKEYAEALRGVLNTGFRASGTYSRCAGANGTSLTVVDFKTFSAKAIAGIRELPDTVADRSIRILLKRKKRDEEVHRFRTGKVAAEGVPIRGLLERWANGVLDDLARLELEPLTELPDRAADIWEPLLGIAFLAGDRWFERAKAAAVALSGVFDDESIGVRLLGDIRTILKDRDRISSETLVSELAGIEESPWGEWGRSDRAITKHALARLLKPYQIVPRTIRVGDHTPKGYLTEQFQDAWARLLPLIPPSECNTATTRKVEPKTAEPETQLSTASNGNRNGSNPHGHLDVALLRFKGGDGLPVPGDPAFPDFIDGKCHAGHLTEAEWIGLRKLHAELTGAAA